MTIKSHLIAALILASIGGAAVPAAIVPGNPTGPDTYEVLPASVDVSAIEKAMGERSEHVWLEGDVLTFAIRSKEGPARLNGGIQQPMNRIQGTDLWTVQLRLGDWSKAIIGYAFMKSPTDLSGKFKVWRGPLAPALVAYAPAVDKVETILMPSGVLGEARTISLVLPKLPPEGEKIPTIILADGQSVDNFGKLLRTLIDEGKVRPVAIVGIHSGGYRGDQTKEYDADLDMRARDYLPMVDEAQFAKHLAWVVDEVLPKAASTLPISTAREDLAVCGYSNGGVFAAAAGMKRADIFGKVMAFSVGIPPTGPKPQGPLPTFRFASGRLEPSFLKGTTKALETVKGWGADARLETYTAAHDSFMWEHAFTVFATELFPAKAKAPSTPGK